MLVSYFLRNLEKRSDSFKRHVLQKMVEGPSENQYGEEIENEASYGSIYMEMKQDMNRIKEWQNKYMEYMKEEEANVHQNPEKHQEIIAELINVKLTGSSQRADAGAQEGKEMAWWYKKYVIARTEDKDEEAINEMIGEDEDFGSAMKAKLTFIETLVISIIQQINKVLTKVIEKGMQKKLENIAVVQQIVVIRAVLSKYLAEIKSFSFSQDIRTVNMYPIYLKVFSGPMRRMLPNCGPIFVKIIQMVFSSFDEEMIEEISKKSKAIGKSIKELETLFNSSPRMKDFEKEIVFNNLDIDDEVQKRVDLSGGGDDVVGNKKYLPMQVSDPKENTILGSASLAEAHRFKYLTKSDNEKVREQPAVLKVLKPLNIVYFMCEYKWLLDGVWDSLKEQVDNVVKDHPALAPKSNALKLQSMQILTFLIENIADEFDYSNEAKNTEEMGEKYVVEMIHSRGEKHNLFHYPKLFFSRPQVLDSSKPIEKGMNKLPFMVTDFSSPLYTTDGNTHKPVVLNNLKSVEIFNAKRPQQKYTISDGVSTVSDTISKTFRKHKNLNRLLDDLNEKLGSSDVTAAKKHELEAEKARALEDFKLNVEVACLLKSVVETMAEKFFGVIFTQNDFHADLHMGNLIGPKYDTILAYVKCFRHEYGSAKIPTTGRNAGDPRYFKFPFKSIDEIRGKEEDGKKLACIERYVDDSINKMEVGLQFTVIDFGNSGRLSEREAAKLMKIQTQDIPQTVQVLNTILWEDSRNDPNFSYFILEETKDLKIRRVYAKVIDEFRVLKANKAELPKIPLRFKDKFKDIKLIHQLEHTSYTNEELDYLLYRADQIVTGSLQNNDVLQGLDLQQTTRKVEEMNAKGEMEQIEVVVDDMEDLRLLKEAHDKNLTLLVSMTLRVALMCGVVSFQRLDDGSYPQIENLVSKYRDVYENNPSVGIEVPFLNYTKLTMRMGNCTFGNVVQFGRSTQMLMSTILSLSQITKFAGYGKNNANLEAYVNDSIRNQARVVGQVVDAEGLWSAVKFVAKAIVKAVVKPA